MTQIKTLYCPEWCEEDHAFDPIDESDLVVHRKKFGRYSNGNLGMVDVWVHYGASTIKDMGSSVDDLEMEGSVDIRELAQACLEAATWMEENLETGQIQSVHR